MNEYGKEKSLSEIIEELAVHCMIHMADPSEIKLILPKKVVDHFSMTLLSKEKVVNPKMQPSNYISDTTMYHFSSEIDIVCSEDYEITKKVIV